MKQREMFIEKDAAFSDCRAYRYALFRTWGGITGYVNFIGLNPSTADETEDDPTIRRCIAYARDWGYAGLVMTNLFAFRATQPKDMMATSEPIGADNDRWLQSVAFGAGLVVAAWGKDGSYLQRDAVVRAMIPNLHYLRLSEKTGQPWHPLYLPQDLKPTHWTPPNASKEGQN